MLNVYRNISPSIVYGTVMSLILVIARTPSYIINFCKNNIALITRMEKIFEKLKEIVEKLKKKSLRVYENHQLVFQKYGISIRNILRAFQ